MNWPCGSLPGRDALHRLLLPSTNAKEMGRTEGVLVLFLGGIGTYFLQGVKRERRS